MEKLDKKALRQLRKLPGFIGYFPGEPDEETGVGMSWCIWENFETAMSAGTNLAHLEAKKAAYLYYKAAVVEHHHAKLSDGQVAVEPFMLPQELDVSPAMAA